MTTRAAPASGHAELMDSVYRTQRHFYDLTRKYYLFGRDRTIRELGLELGGSLLEIGCGTGRNLASAARHWPRAELFGVDISNEMLRSAAAQLGPRARLAQGDAASLDPQALFARSSFDRVMIPFALSMIPAWKEALDRACGLLAPGGALHVVDFGPMRGLPAPLRALLQGWLARFHVTPREHLFDEAATLAARHGLDLRTRLGPGGYYQQIVLSRLA